MKIATYNVNGVNGRLPVLLRWLNETKPDVACLQELKAPQEKFPEEAILNAGYQAIWHGQKSWNGVAILSRIGKPEEIRRVLPGDPEDMHSRYIEAMVGGILVGCLYLPNGNPAPGPKFDYKMNWFQRFNAHAAELLASHTPVVLTGDYNAIPTEQDVYKPERWLEDALFRPETRQAFKTLVAQGWTDALRKMHPGETIYTFWDYFRNAYGRNAGLRIDHFLLSPELDKRLIAADVDRNVRGWKKTSDHAPVWIEKRRIDPGLLEKTEGNVFRTRIYPVPAHGERSLIIAYEQELSIGAKNELLYHLALSSKDTIQKFSLGIDVQQRDNAPVLQSSPVRELNFLLQRGHYCAHEQREHIVLDKPLDIRITKLSTEAESFVQKKNGEHFFYLQTFLPPVTKDKKLPGRLSVIWDNSLSGLYRNTAMEIKLLEAYLERLDKATIQLYTINNTFKSAGTYEVRDGNAKAFIERLQKMVYDGGTDYAKIKFADADETLLFSDGLSTLSETKSITASHLVYTITSSPKADYSVLRSVAEQNGGSLINLANVSIEEAMRGLTRQALLFLGIRNNEQVVEYYPAIPITVQNGFSMAGKLNEAPSVITLQFGYGKAVAFEKTIQLQYDEYDISDWDLSKLFAQKKIQELEKDYDRNKDEILLLGKLHSIVTQNTSLLVLEDVMDYVRHEIEPPLELRSEYKRLLKERRDVLTRQQQHTLDNAIEYSNSLWEWYHTTFPVKKKPASKYAEYETMDVAISTVDTAMIIADEGIGRAEMPPPPPPSRQEAARVQEMRLTPPGVVKDEEAAVSMLQGSVAGVQVNQGVVVGYSTRKIELSSNRVSNRNQLIIVDGQVATSLPPQEQIKNIEALEPKAGTALYGSTAMNGVLLVTTKGAKEREEPQINLEEKVSSAAYLNVLSKTPREQQYKTYLEFRDKNMLNPTFYYDMATFFLKQDKTLGLQILTNLGELDFQNHELLKLLGFKLKELGELDIQQYVFRKVLLWRPQEPQSYRDYALALAEKGKYQAALDTLYLALTKDYNSDVMNNYEGIEETIVTEINHLISKYRSILNTSAINQKIVHSMLVDIRVVLNWNMNDTDIDLWVTDPTGEKCFYSHKQTRMGGHLSEDFTDGYGPEQFLLKKAAKGKYKIQVHYYGERGVKVAGKTTLLVEVFTNYGRSTEQRKVITLQLEGEEREGVYVGEFVF